MVELGIASADIGLPGAGARAASTCTRSPARSSRRNCRSTPNCAARTLRARRRSRCSHRRRRPAFRSRRRDLHRLVAHSPVRRGLDARPDVAGERGGRDVRGGEGLPVMFVTEDTTRAAARHAAGALRHRDSLGRAAALPRRHGRSRDARRRARPGALRRDEIIDAEWRDGAASTGTATATAARAGERARRHRGGRRSRARHRARRRRARRQHRDGSAAW